MEEKKKEKKGFWNTLFAPKKSSCCDTPIELINEDEETQENSCSCSCNPEMDSCSTEIKPEESNDSSCCGK